MHGSDISIITLKLHKKREPKVRGTFVYMKRDILSRVLAWSPEKYNIRR